MAINPNPVPLSTLEQISPQAYTRFVVCFRLDPRNRHEDVARILQEALNATASSIHLLTQAIISNHVVDGKKRTALINSDASILTINNLDDEDIWVYDGLRSRGFPASAFDGNVLFRTGIFADPRSLRPSFLAKANFIRGGLLLGISFWHGVFDGAAITHVLRIWAQNCETLQEKKVTAVHDQVLSTDAFDKSRLSVSVSSEGVTAKDHPEFILLPEAPSEVPPVLTKVLETQIFHFTPSALSSLKEAASPLNATEHQTGQAWTSTNIALSALLWRSMMVATYCNHKPPSDTTSIFCSPLNVRARMNPPLTPDLLATAWCFQTSYLPMTSLLSSEHNLADTALVVRKATADVDAKYVDSLIGMINSVPDPSLLVPLAFTDVTRTSTMLTSWATFPLYDFDWGEMFGGRCERIRTAAGGMFNGMAVVLPELPKEIGGGLEVVVGGEDHVLEALRKDSTWKKYTV